MISISDIQKSVNSSVLCWLATASKEGKPNVSPKEIFALFGESIIIANIASPQSYKNIVENGLACVSFIDILVQKGYKIKGPAQIIHQDHQSFETMSSLLIQKTNGKFPFKSIIEIKIEMIKEILAPRYILYPDTTEAEQIESSKKLYGLK